MERDGSVTASTSTSSPAARAKPSLSNVTTTSSSSIASQAQQHHPLSPRSDPAMTRPASSLLTGSSGGLFEDLEDGPEREDELVDDADEQHEGVVNDASIRYKYGEDLQTPKGLAASPNLRVRSQTRASPTQGNWIPTTIRLPSAPHMLPTLELKRRLDEQNSDVMALALAQELSRQLTEALTDLAVQQARQTAREQALLQIVRDNASGGNVTEGTIERALLRATSEASEVGKQVADQQPTSWKATVRLPKEQSPSGKKAHGKVSSAIFILDNPGLSTSCRCRCRTTCRMR